MNKRYKLDAEKFHNSLPKRLSATIYLEVESIDELSVKVDALVGRRYENEDGNAGYYISDIRQVSFVPVTEFYVMPDPGSTNSPIPHTVYHAIVIPAWEKLPTMIKQSGATTKGNDGGSIVGE